MPPPRPRGQVSRRAEVRRHHRCAGESASRAAAISERVRRPAGEGRAARSDDRRDHRGDAVVHRRRSLRQGVFPDRAFDVGIAEQHAVTFAAGLAAQGMRPFCAIYSTFLQRAYDQVVHDVAIQNLRCASRSIARAWSAADGATHAGSFDVTYLALCPISSLMAAADEAELVHMTHNRRAARQRADRGALSARGGRRRRSAGGAGAAGDRQGPRRARGQDGAILSLGTRLEEALKAADTLEAKGCRPRSPTCASPSRWTRR